MRRVRVDSTTPVFEDAKTVHALDRAATVIGISYIHTYYVYDKVKHIKRKRCFE
jgi:hypothetical protein